jgi:RNA methyltransferase, TrmH family
MEIITSRNNRSIIECTKLKDRKYRDETGLFFFEGKKLYEEAVKCNIKLIKIFYAEECSQFIESFQTDAEKILVSDSVYEKISDEKSPQGIFCVAKHIDKLHKYDKINGGIEFDFNIKGSGFFIAEGIRDPGNLGTILRTASALGIDILLLSDDCADIYNPKTVRAGMGAIFRQRTLRLRDLASAVSLIRNMGIHVYAAALDNNSVQISKISKKDNGVCFAVGNEGHGLSKNLISACEKSIIIPMQNNCESLNVAAATTILMWEQHKINSSK